LSGSCLEIDNQRALVSIVVQMLLKLIMRQDLIAGARPVPPVRATVPDATLDAARKLVKDPVVEKPVDERAAKATVAVEKKESAPAPRN
jgi:hypothetical protein